MSANRDQEVPAANETTRLNDDPTPFALRAETVRQKARESTGADVQQILEQGQVAMRALRERHALELLAAEAESKSRKVPWVLPASIALLSALGACGFALFDRTQLSDDPTSSFTPPEIRVEMALALAEAHAEREVGTQATSKRSIRRSRTARTVCDPNSFDPIDACL